MPEPSLPKECAVFEKDVAQTDDELEAMAKHDPLVHLCATAAGVGLIVAATFLSAIENLRRAA